MNKPITNRVKNAPNSPAKQSRVVMKETTTIPGQAPTAGTITTQSEGFEYTGTNRNPDIYNVLDNEISSGFAKEKYGYEGTDAKEYEQLKLKRRYDRGDANIKAGKTTTVETPGTPGTPDKVTSHYYKPEIVKNQTQTTPWENRWADRIADQQVREGRQDARRRLRKIGVEEFKTLRREGAGLRDAFKGMRDIQTGRGNLSDYERDLYETKRGLKDVEEAQAAENAYRTLATRGDNVKTVHDFTAADAGTTEGGTTLKNYETNLGGKPEIGPGNAAEPQNWNTGINARKKSREAAAFAADAAAASAEEARTKRLVSEAKAGIESDIVGKMPKGNDGTIDSKGNPTNKAKSLDDITLNVTDTKLESVPEDNADFKPLEKKTRLNRKKPKIDIKVPDALRMRDVKVEKPVGSPSDQASSGFNIEPEKQILGSEAPAKMTFGRNVGMQSKSALKKGYFKNK